MAAQFQNFKVSFIWVETVPGVFAQQLEPTAKYAFLGKPGYFDKNFNDLKASAAPKDLGLALPWPRPRGQHFWKFYFAGRHAGDISGKEAWKNRVPLRANATAYTAEPPGNADQLPVAKFIYETFCMPQGIGCIVTAHYRSDTPRPLDDMVKLAHAVRYRYRFHTAAQPRNGGMSLDSLADASLDAAAKGAFGKAEAFAGNNQPFTIATFVQGHTDEPNVTEGSLVHHALEALTTWSEDDWASKPLKESPLQTARLRGHRPGANDIIYARDNGRAIWLPREFERPSPVRPPRLSCYHRNLTLASLQTMSLGECVGYVARQRQRGERINPLLLQRARESAGVLAALASGDAAATYRTMSVDRQIDAANYRALIKLVTDA
jgi:hypothetical protein